MDKKRREKRNTQTYHNLWILRKMLNFPVKTILQSNFTRFSYSLSFQHEGMNALRYLASLKALYGSESPWALTLAHEVKCVSATAATCLLLNSWLSSGVFWKSALKLELDSLSPVIRALKVELVTTFCKSWTQWKLLSA